MGQKESRSMKTCILVEYKSPAGSYWYHPDHPLCQDGQVLWEFPEEEDNTAVEMAALNFACAVMNKEPDDKVKTKSLMTK